MTAIDWTLTGMGLWGAACLAISVLYGQMRYKDGWDDHADHEKQRAYLRRLRQDEASRSRARRALPAGQPWYVPAPASRPRPSRVVMTSGEAAPVAVVPVGPARIPLRPQPSRISGAGTVPFGRLLTDTGEIRAIGAQMIADIERQGERMRQEMIQP